MKKAPETPEKSSSVETVPSVESTSNTTPAPDPLKEFETEHIPEVPHDDHSTSAHDIDEVDTQVNGKNGPVKDVDAMIETPNPESGNRAGLTLLFVLLLLALLIIPIAVVFQSYKEGVVSSKTFQSFAAWLGSVTGI